MLRFDYATAAPLSGSFDRIDYTLRPAKYAERRMIRDIFRKVAPFEAPEDYVYVGFGSVWFADFILFHRSLGTKEMISIESSVKAKERVADNAPFSIELRFARSETALPLLDWTRHQFLWLDYDDALDMNKLRDCDTVASRSRSGTLLAITVCAKSAKEAAADAKPGESIVNFIDTFGAASVPRGTGEDDLIGWPFADVSRAMLLQRIEAAVARRNGLGGEVVTFRPICSINYADGVPMTTLIGMFVGESDENAWERCEFGSLDFIDDPLRPVRIEVPLLTPREVARIEAQLPLSAGRPLDLGSIPEKQAKRLVKLYRHLPNYMVAES